VLRAFCGKQIESEMTFDFKGARFERLVVFCRRINGINQTPDLISFVAAEKEHVGFCGIIADLDEKFEKRFAGMCQANRIDPDDIRRRMRLVASVLGIYKQVDYYNVLGVSPDADEDTIKQAYREKAQILHPDKSSGDAENGKAFIKLHDAYVHLSDPKVRKVCDQTHDGSGYWVERQKSSKIPAWGVGFGRFLSWMFVSIGSAIIVSYAFHIYKNGLITFFFEQLRSNQKESRAKAVKIVRSKMLHPNSDSALETEFETEAALNSIAKENRVKKINDEVASLAKAKSVVFQQQHQTKIDRPVVKVNKNRTVKKPVSAKKRQRQKKKKKVVMHSSAGTSKETIARVLNINIVKKNRNKKVYYLHEQKRLLTFLEKYTSTYEQKDLSRFRTFFTKNAIEQGKPFESLLPTYRQTFNRVEALKYHINLRSFTVDNSAKKILVEGVYTASYQLPEKDWGNSSGTIRMELLDSSRGLMVSRLDYDRGIR
jgi:curved DNA-binding protein CbpA